MDGYRTKTFKVGLSVQEIENIKLKLNEDITILDEKKADRTDLFSKNYNDLTDKPYIPVNLSDLNNDIKFITDTVNNLVNYYTKTELIEILGSFSSLKFDVVDTLPEDNISENIIYLTPSEDYEESNVYDEYIYLKNKWELIGSTKVNLSEYLKRSEASIDSQKLGGQNPDYYLNYNNLTDAPQKINIVAREEPSADTEKVMREIEIFGDKWKLITITKTSELLNDSGFVTQNSLDQAIGDINSLLDTINGEVI